MSSFIEDVVGEITDVVEDVAGGVGDVVEDVGGAVTDVVEKVVDVVTDIIEDPKKLAAVAISVAFPGAGLAIGQSLLGPTLAASLGATVTQVIGQTIINTAINGGNLEQGLMTAGISAMTPALAKEISDTAVKQGVDKTLATAGAKVAAGTIQAAALGQDPITALTFGAVDQATNAVLNKALSDSGMTNQYNALPDAAKVAINASITSALTGADASTLAANQIVQRAIGLASQEVKHQDVKEFARKQFADIGYDMTEEELNQVIGNVDNREQAKTITDEVKKFPSVEYYQKFDGDKEKFDEYVAKTEEDKIVEFLESQGVSPTPERVASIAKEFNIDITKPVEGLSSAVEKYKQSNVLSVDEIKQIAQSKGIQITEDEALRYAGEGDKSTLKKEVDTFLDFKSTDQKQLQTNNSRIATNILNALEAEGYTPETITKLIDDGTVKKFVDQYKEAQQQTVESLRNNAIAAEQQFGVNSKEAIQARQSALNAMSEFGGYGVSKDQQGNFKTADAEIDPNTMIAVYKGSSGGYDPITGQLRVNVVWKPDTQQITYGDWLSKQKDQPYAGLIAYGQSASPPAVGGISVYGDGSGTQSGFPGLTLVAVDDGTGAKVYEDAGGKAIVLYSDGKAFVKEPNKNEINWINLQEIPRISEDLKKIDQKTAQDANQKDKAIAEINDQIDQGYINPSEAMKLLEEQGFKPTDADAQKIIGLKTVEQATKEASEYAQANTITRDEARQALIDAGIPNPTDFDIDALTGQYAQTDLTGKVQQVKPQAEIRSAVRDVIGEGNSALSKAIDEAKAQGLAGDAALQSAIDKVAGDLGLTKTELLAEIGKTETNLREQFADKISGVESKITDVQNALSDAIDEAKAQGLAGDAALQSAINKVSNRLNKTKTDLLRELGKTEDDLRTDFASEIGEVKTQISDVQKTLEDKIAENEKAGLTRDEATQKAVQDVANSLGKTKEQLLGQIGQTEQSLRDLYTTGQKHTEKLITALDQATQEKFDSLTAEQQKQALALAESTKDLTGAINSVAQNAATQLSNVQTQIKEQINNLSTTTQTQYNALNQSQKDEVAARVKMGEDLNKAITDVSGQVTGLEESIADIEKRQAEEAKKAEAGRQEQARLQRYRNVFPSGLGSIVGAGMAAPYMDTSVPEAKPEFLTTQITNKDFEGGLSDFFKQVEESNILPENTEQQKDNSDMTPYFNYGSEQSIDQILGLGTDQQTNPAESGYGVFASGGMVTPLMAGGGQIGTGTRYGKYAGGGMPSPLMAAGGKMRVDFRKGDAVTGPGDGQSDDIPAMLADGEFVFPADVVAAIGNGSTKAGSDKLYDMMHGIRAHVRSAKPKDLPPEIKSPLDFLNKKRRA